MDFFAFYFSTEAGTSEIATPVLLRKCGSAGEGIKCKAVWDTGATSSMISAAIAKKMTLAPHGSVQIAGVHGVSNAKCYYVDIAFDNGFVIPGIKVSEASDFGGFDVLIGMDIIGRGKMYIDGTNSKLDVRFYFPIPSAEYKK